MSEVRHPLIPADSAQIEIRVVNSRFIANAGPAASVEAARAFIAGIRAALPDASHHVYAYVIGHGATTTLGMSDDGEPSGTAGRPILNTLLSNELTNILAVVVRYFGGTLLGVPGLINAYKSATVEAVKNAKIIEKTVNSVFRIEFGHPQMNEVMKIVKEEDLKISNQNFDLNCSFSLEIRQSQVNKVIGRLEKVEGLRWKS